MTSPPHPIVPPVVRPLRADARRNRERILKAARIVFADQGVDAQIDDVARRAKVGIGTVYRHFPTKQSLLDAIVREHFETIAGFAREALEQADGWEGFSQLIWRAAGHNASDRAFCELVAGTDKRALAAETGLVAMTEELMERAKAQGSLRADASNDDVPLIMIGATAVMTAMRESDAWRRYLTLVLDGMRAS